MNRAEEAVRYSREAHAGFFPESAVTDIASARQDGAVEFSLREIIGIGPEPEAVITGTRESHALLRNKAGIRQLFGRKSTNGVRKSAGNVPLLKLFDVQEEVAKRIAQRLHDEAAQMLAVVYMELAEIAKECPEPAVRKINGVIANLDTIREQLRQLSHELRPLILDQLGLMAALDFMADGVRKRSGLQVAVSGRLPRRLPHNLETVLYRVVQEALSNVVRHASATRVRVELWMDEEAVRCTVSDDGIGFPMSDGKGAAASGLGLVGINERVVALDGDCKIVSRRGKGTELQVEIPL